MYFTSDESFEKVSKLIFNFYNS